MSDRTLRGHEMVPWVLPLAVLLSVTALSASVRHNKSPWAACVTTRLSTPRFVPPSPYWQDASKEMFWYGSNSLWTLLGIQGTWYIDRNALENRGVYSTKLVYWRQGFDWRTEVDPDLRVIAKRLDRKAPLVLAAPAHAVFVTRTRPAMMVGIDIPSAGCWELTAEYHEHKLSFVVSVQP
jgi:hypothetical protein